MGTNKIYIFFLGLSLLFWNPAAYYFLYRNTPSFSIQWIFILYSIVFLAAFGVIYLFARDRIPSKLKNPILSVSIAGIFFALMVLINYIISDKYTKREGLIFEPGTQVRYTSTEFDWLAKINSLGLREKEFNINKGDKFRILCIGDSWTYGWGVNNQDTYPQQLENYFRSKGKNVEVINGGKAGGYTTIYEQQLKKLIPALKPDMVLVGILQGDDLAQSYEMDSSVFKIPKKEIGFFEKLLSEVKIYLKSSLGNMVASLKPKKQVTVQYNWLQSATSVINGFSSEQQSKFHLLQDTVQKLFKTGNLNPSLMHFYIDLPDRLLRYNDPNDSATNLAMSRMNRDLEGMKSTCQENRSELVFVNMPTSNFTGHQVIRNPSDSLDPYLVASNKIDSMYHSLATRNNLPYIEMTHHFISLQDKTAYFYRFDGHPNARGYKEIATYIGNQILDSLHYQIPIK